MADKWELCIIDMDHEKVGYFSPKTWERNCGTIEFMEAHYPGRPKLDKKNYNYPVLIQQLLFDGWEPFALGGNDVQKESLCFRRKISA